MSERSAVATRRAPWEVLVHVWASGACVRANLCAPMGTASLGPGAQSSDNIGMLVYVICWHHKTPLRLAGRMRRRRTFALVRARANSGKFLIFWRALAHTFENVHGPPAGNAAGRTPATVSTRCASAQHSVPVNNCRWVLEKRVFSRRNPGAPAYTRAHIHMRIIRQCQPFHLIAGDDDDDAGVVGTEWRRVRWQRNIQVAVVLRSVSSYRAIQSHLVPCGRHSRNMNLRGETVVGVDVGWFTVINYCETLYIFILEVFFC